jgi:hypothetical protein
MKNNLTGKKFGRLTAIAEHSKKHRKIIWSCKCECGKEVNVIGSDLVRGKTKSCGCLKKEIHTTHGMHNSRLYIIWTGMKQRVNNDKTGNYGNRGIKFCEEWTNFINFYNDMVNEYEEHCKQYGESNTTLDRIDVNGDYCRENCRWATYQVQENNKRNNTKIVIEGKVHTLRELSIISGIKYSTLESRIKEYKYPINKILSPVVRGGYKGVRR